MSEEEINPNAVQIHLNFMQDTDQLHVDFPFDPEKDDLDTVVNDLITTLGYGPEQRSYVKQLISEQINKALRKPQYENSSSGNEYNPNSPPESPQNSTKNISAPSMQGSNNAQINEDDDSEEILNDPEYIQLLEKQKKELKELKARHTSEQQALAQKLAPSNVDDDLLIF